jgi:hypothetical protein
MRALTFLILASVVLVAIVGSSSTGILGRLPAVVRLAIDLLFVAAAVRIGFSVSILAFDLEWWSYAIPALLGVLAWLIRPGRHLAQG